MSATIVGNVLEKRNGHMKRMFSWRRIGVAGIIGAAALVALGDRGKAQVPPGGIDPLEVLSLQVRANAIIVLDSSGSMREMPDVDPNNTTTPVGGEVAGDDPTSKLRQAKTVLQQVVVANESRVSFQFGRYVQDANSYGPERNERFLYTTTCDTALPTGAACNTAANNLLITNAGGAACNGPECNSGLYRVAGMQRTVGTVTTYHVYANKFFNGEYVQVRTNGTTAIAPPAGPGVVSDLGDFGPTTLPPLGPGPWVEVQNIGAAPGNLPLGTRVRFQFRGIRWSKGNNTSASCGGFESLVGLAPCTDNIQIDAIGPHIAPELELTATGNIVGYTNQAIGGAPGAAQQPPLRGIRASGLTPIAESLMDLKNPVFQGIWSTLAGLPAASPKPRTFLIFVTDGDDSCTGPTTADTSTGVNADNRALRAAHKAQLLYQRIVATEPASSVTTFVISFGSGASSTRSDWIAWGGSGMNQSGSFCGPAPLPACIPLTGTGGGARWSRPPTATERAACTTCRDAFVAADADELVAALQAAIDQGQSQGEFSDQQSITDSIFELTQTIVPAGGPSPPPSPNPSDPETRYSSSLPVLLQSTFDMPNFDGHLKAFRNDAGASLQIWDAGQKLQARVATVPINRSFEQLCGAAGATPAAGATCTTAAAIQANPNLALPNLLKRRIYTTTRNGVFLTGSDTTIVGNLVTPDFTPAGQVALWPPDPSIDPVAFTSPGILDDALGLAVGTLTPEQKFTQLQQLTGACTPSYVPPATPPASLPVECRLSTAVATRLPFAVKEARRIILAHAAGAALVKTGNAALRATTRLQFNPRPWVLAESTLAASAVVTPPLPSLPRNHNAEYKLFRDGPRTSADLAVAGLPLGFGLRNPDLDANPAANVSNATLKPVMSVIYHGTNHMVHAFRAGFQSASATGLCTQSATNECGGEELWAFVPFDQLSKLIERIKPQVRNPHTYVVAAPIRVADIFVPGNFSTTAGGVGVSGAGVWRTVILFGRGIGGKYLTALDITAPGRFNELSLSTAPPIVMWSRGNPDTTLGTPTIGTPTGNAYNNTAADFTAYTGMGQTWSVPAVSFVTAAQNTTPRRSQGVEFVAFVGSGYGLATEGTTIYTLDMLTGDVVRSADISDRTGVPYENALVASAAAFNPGQLVAGTAIGNPAADKSTRVYIPDIHGRIWRLTTDSTAPPVLFADAGANQPFGNPVALLNYAGSGTTAKPHVFAESGNENRIFPPPTDTPPFRMFGLRDDDLSSDPNNGTPDVVDGPAWELFTIDFPNGFRGTVQPATAFNASGKGRVFFAGTRFNPVSTPNAPPPPPCVSSFDSVLFAVGAETGGAAYDLNASGDDRSIQINQQRIQAIRVSEGQLVVDVGLRADNPPPAPAPPTVHPPAPAPLANVLMGPPLNPDGTSRIPGLVTYKVSSSVCR